MNDVLKRGCAALAVALLSLSLAPATWAHAGHLGGGVLAGLLHPVRGLDHIALLVAAGVWIGMQRRRTRLPAAALFLGAMGLGVALGATGTLVPGAETLGTLALVALIALAVPVALRQWNPYPLGLGLLALGALLHGNLHGAEAAVGGGVALLSLTAGLLATSAGLLGGGVALARWRLHPSPRRSAMAALGSAALVAGLLVWVA